MSGGGHFLASLHRFESLSKTVVPRQSVRLGFTLAEVLVTLGIISVVSAMTVPTLMQNYQKKSYVTQLHKFYNEMSQALMQYQADNNAINLKEAGFRNQDNLNNFIRKYFKVVSECGKDRAPCFAESYKKINGLDIIIDKTVANGDTFTLASGQTVNISYTEGTYKFLVALLIDVNGQKGPNIQGRDLFEMYIYDPNSGWFIDDLNPDATSVVPLTEDQREDQFTKYCLAGTASNRHGCFGKILNDNWEMSY